MILLEKNVKLNKKIKNWKNIYAEIKLTVTLFFYIIPSLTVMQIKKRYSPQFIKAPAIGALVLLFSNVQLAKMQALT